jgi:hypothetical protein
MDYVIIFGRLPALFIAGSSFFVAICSLCETEVTSKAVIKSCTGKQKMI